MANIAYDRFSSGRRRLFSSTDNACFYIITVMRKYFYSIKYVIMKIRRVFFLNLFIGGLYVVELYSEQ